MAKEHIAYTYKLCPTEKQKILFEKTFGCCRKIYNLMLEDNKKHYKETKKFIIPTPAKYKDEYEYLKEVDSLALANEQMFLKRAFGNLFKKKSKCPHFKSKKNDKDSYTTSNVSGSIRVTDKEVRLPKVGLVKAKIHREIPKDYVIKTATVTKEKDGTFFVSLTLEYESDVTPIKEVETHIGLDYKSDGLFVSSKGDIPDTVKFYRKSEKKLGKAQRKLSKKVKGSRNYKKQKRKVAKISKHVANQRKDYLHKLSAELTSKYDLISVETLNMRAMSRRLNLGKSTMDNGFGMFVFMLEYKQKQKGHYLIKVDKFFPSSQLCQCGYKNPTTKDLKVRTIKCPKCGATYDRDLNAAINIDKEGYRLYKSL